MKKRLIGILLLMSMFIGGCSNVTQGESDGTEGAAPPESTDEVVPEETEYNIFSVLPEKNFNGDDFIFYIPTNEDSPVDKGLYAEELVGLTFEDAVYNRNLSVEKEYNVHISTYQGGWYGSTYDDLKLNVSAGDNAYDVYFTHVQNRNPAIVGEKLCLEWDYIPYLQMEETWWNQTATHNLNMANKTFFAVSSINIQDVILLVFNKEIAQANSVVGNPYEYVREGTWTIDKLREIAEGVTLDLNGDGEIIAEDDQFGLVYGKGWQLPALMYACDVVTVDLDENGYPNLAVDNERMYNIYEKLYHLCYSSGTHLFSGNYPDVGMETGQVLFCQYNLFTVETLRSGDVDYGILPLPKYDETQNGYMTNSWTGMMCVPTTTPEENYEMIGILMESLSYLGYRDVVPQYYDNVLKYKVSRDEDSAEMLDIILSDIVYDVGMNFFSNNCAGNMMGTMLNSKIQNYASTLRKKTKAMAREYEKMYNAVVEAGQ